MLFDKVATKNNFMINSVWRFLPIFSVLIFLTTLLPNINAQDLDGSKLYRSNCSSCHGGTSSLFLDTHTHVMDGGGSGEVIISGNSATKVK